MTEAPEEPKLEPCPNPRAEQLLSLRKVDVMRAFLAIADMDDGTFAVLSIDPTQRVGTGCRAIVLSVHEDRGDAEVALQEMSNDHRH